MRRFAVLLPLVLIACTMAQVEESKTNADDAIAKAREEINMACWAMQTADVAFQIFVAPRADPAILDNEKKAVEVASATCASPPANVREARATILSAYKVATTAAAVTGI